MRDNINGILIRSTSQKHGYEHKYENEYEDKHAPQKSNEKSKKRMALTHSHVHM
jgi:hypothetical protein